MSSLNRLAPSTTITPLSGQRSGSGMPPLPSPFSFPFSTLPLGLNLFDVASTSSAASSSSSQVIDPARILNLLHQQTLLAEELLKYHNMLFPGSNPGVNPFMDSLTSKPSIEFFKLPTTEQKDSNDKNDPSSSNTNKRTSTTVASSTSEIDLTINKDSSSEIRSETSTPIIKPRPESELLSDKPSTSISAAAVSAMLIDPDELKCHICMAQFPSLWLLEQHTALQHSQLSGNDKPFKCDQCGQNYRYNCCHYQSTLLRNQEINSNFNRSRIPADKLFTCDVCGMQFRYLKSFKKHRLNHALERLHGKKDKLATGENSGELMVSSTNDESGSKGQINLEDEAMLSDEEQDETIDSISNINTVSNNSNSVDPNTSISSDNTGGDITDKNSAIIDCDIQITSGNTAQSESNQLTESKSQEAESTIPTASTSLAMHNVPNNFQMQHTSNSLKNLLSAETITNQQLMGLNSQEVSILNFLRVDAAEKQRDKRFACPFCGKCVRSKENLKLHVRKHTGERPFVCLFCGRAFGGKSDLTRHLRIHTGERPYHCESCGKCFARADYLSKHLTTHVHNTQQQQQR